MSGGEAHLDEPVKVAASFDRQKIRIHFFIWQERLYHVTRVNMFHISQDGARREYNFSVYANDNSYLLSFNPQTLTWRLREAGEW